MKAKIRGTEIYFDVTGVQIVSKEQRLTEKPVLFLIHGGPGGNHLHFKTDSIELQNDAQLVFIDQRGCGFSKTDKKSNYTLENNIEDIEALRKYLGLNKICVLGVSYGGMVAQGYAIRYGKHIDKLVLVATAPSFHFIAAARENLKKIGTKQQIAACEKYLWNGKIKDIRNVNHFFKLMDPLYSYTYDAKKGKSRHFAAKHHKATTLKSTFSQEALDAGFGGFLHTFNFIPQLKKIKCPTLVLAGKHDWICLPEQSKLIADKIPHATLKIFNRCGHSIAKDVNTQYIKEIKRFLLQKTIFRDK